MSRWLAKNFDGTYDEEIASMDECRWLINDTCCNDRSDQCCDFPHTEEYCKKRCPHFTPEEGLEDETETTTTM